MSFDRRDFLKLGAAGVALSVFPGCATTSGNELVKKTGPRVVVVGGGFGGATAAKYIRMWSNNQIEVVLVERNAAFVSCPMSNTVLGGIRTIKDLTRGYDTLGSKHGVKLVHGEVTAIDPQKQVVKLADGHLSYDRLIVAPGIDFMFNKIEGLDAKVAAESIPHAWKAGPQTVLLRKQLESMPDGGVFAISIPKAPYRCPPGPYERACQVAFYLKNHKPKSKVLILDANPDITAKKGLFTAAWKELYPGMVEYRGNAEVTKVDVAGKVMKTEFEDVKADVLNIIPPMKAGAIAEATGLADVGGRWCGVDFLTYESKAQSNIHVIGDSIAAKLPKAGHMANSQAKICAAAVVELLQGNQPDPNPSAANTCYSMVNGDEAVNVAIVLRYDAAKKEMVVAQGSGVSDKRSQLEGTLAGYWLNNIMDDVLG
jgi:NADPH-dependent 2,4-dienoyl-CoA reductase/sulfur reductase-like enzyme